jgi:hypothetical protein
MVKVNSLNKKESKKLPSQLELESFGIEFNSRLERFETDSGVYKLSEFQHDYYNMDFEEFDEKLHAKLGCRLSSDGYVVYRGSKFPVKNIAFFANYQLKFLEALQTGHQKGNWVKTVARDVNITTHQTNIVSYFIDSVIEQEDLQQSDIIMLKYLKRIDQQRFSIYKIFNSVDVRDKKSLVYTINTYADGFFAQNEDYSVDIDRLELDIIKALKGDCQKRELKTNDASKRVVHPKATNNNCFFKCIQPFIPQLMASIGKVKCNKIRQAFGLKDNQEVDVQTALKIFTHYSNGLSGLEIWTNDTLIVEVKGPSPTLRLLLNENHYSMLTFKEIVVEQKCSECGREFKYTHNCNTNGIVYYKIHVGNDRFVINQFKPDSFNYDETNDEVVIVCYDIETHTRKQVGKSKIHTPYIVGFVDNITNEFQYFTGSDCMERFINHLKTYSDRN